MSNSEWRPPSDWLRITATDAHTEGEPFRVVTGGFPALVGDTILACRRDAKTRFDHLRTALMLEPRGHADMYGCLVTPPKTPEADLGVLFIHNEGYSTMCGHGIIGITTVALETGMKPAAEPETTLRIDTPAGLVTAHATVERGRVRRVRFENVPSFLAARDRAIHVPGYGTVRYDIAYGGAFYAFVQAPALGLELGPEGFRSLIDAGRAIKQAIMADPAANADVTHPFEDDLSFLYGVIFVGPPEVATNHSRNVCVFADGEVDRSPTGTGVSARLALHHARGDITTGPSITIESILGTCFRGRVVGETTYGPHAAVTPEVTGRAFITGRNEFLIDPDDPLREGFLLR